MIPLSHVKIVDALTALNAAGYLPTEQTSKAAYITLHTNFDATAAAGVVLIESSHDKDYTGTWVVEDTVTFSAASKAHISKLVGPRLAVRARISSAVTSGTVDVNALIVT